MLLAPAPEKETKRPLRTPRQQEGTEDVYETVVEGQHSPTHFSQRPSIHLQPCHASQPGLLIQTVAGQKQARRRTMQNHRR